MSYTDLCTILAEGNSSTDMNYADPVYCIDCGQLVVATMV